LSSTPALFDRFERIVIISLPERTDRRREMKEQLQKVGLDGDPRVRFFDALKLPDAGRFGSIGANGCFNSHLSALRENRDRSILLLEDDCDFTNDIFEAWLPEDFDILWGGYLEASDPDDLDASDLIGAHCIGFNAGRAAMVVDYLDDLLADRIEHDPRAVKDANYDPDVLPPVDGAYVWFRRAHPELKTVFPDPQIAVQRPSRTDIGHLRFFDRLPGLREAAEWARRVKRKLA
jgi:glycosyl transferase family 25